MLLWPLSTGSLQTTRAGEGSDIKSLAVIVAIPDTSAPANAAIQIPVTVSNAVGMAGIELKIFFDPAILTAQTEDFILADSIFSGEVRIALARATGFMSSGGSIVAIDFQVTGSAQIGDTTTLALREVAAFDSVGVAIPATVVSGLFTVAPPTIANILVSPNPFTPNDDGFNDFIGFRFPGMFEGQAEILIFNLAGRQVRHLTTFSGDRFEWDGRDEDGRELEPGVYLYLIKSNGSSVANGSVTLMR